jgi:hypothetical protein
MDQLVGWLVVVLLAPAVLALGCGLFFMGILACVALWQWFFDELKDLVTHWSATR